MKYRQSSSWALQRPPQYRRVMIPLTVLRRLDCVLDDTRGQVIAIHQKLKADEKYDAETIEKIINQKFNLTFHNTSEFTFQKLLGDPDKLAANLINFMAGFSSRARKIIEEFKFEEEIEKLDEANRLFEVIKAIAAVDLHLDRIPQRLSFCPGNKKNKTWTGHEDLKKDLGL